jgi:hypothetical protein
MNYAEIVNPAETMARITKLMQPTIIQINKALPATFVQASKQFSEVMKPVPYEMINKNIQSLFSKSAIQVVADFQSKQTENLRKSLAAINELNRQRLHDELVQTLDKDNEPNESIDEEVEISMPVETKTIHFAVWVNLTKSHPLLAILVAGLFFHYVRDPVWNYVDAHYIFPTVLSWLKWFVQFISFP